MSGAQGMVADVLLGSLGGRTVLLRVPAPAVAGDDAEQVGSATPQFQDVELGPVVFRRVRSRVTTAGVEAELLVSATAVMGLVGTFNAGSAAVLFRDAAGVVVDDVLLAITGVSAAEAFGAAYLFRVQVRGAVGAVV